MERHRGRGWGQWCECHRAGHQKDFFLHLDPVSLTEESPAAFHVLGKYPIEHHKIQLHDGFNMNTIKCLLYNKFTTNKTTVMHSKELLSRYETNLSVWTDVSTEWPPQANVANLRTGNVKGNWLPTDAAVSCGQDWEASRWMWSGCSQKRELTQHQSSLMTNFFLKVNDYVLMCIRNVLVKTKCFIYDNRWVETMLTHDEHSSITYYPA